MWVSYLRRPHHYFLSCRICSPSDSVREQREKSILYAVSWGAEKKITDGTTETTFSPDQECKRSEIVTFLYRDAAAS